MAQSLKQINMNFQKTEKAASYLKDAAHFLHRFSANENEYIQHQLKKNWTGENATVFSMQNQRLFYEVDILSRQMMEEAYRIQHKAHLVRDAEERAYAIAQERAQKAKNK